MLLNLPVELQLQMCQALPARTCCTLKETCTQLRDLITRFDQALFRQRVLSAGGIQCTEPYITMGTWHDQLLERELICNSIESDKCIDLTTLTCIDALVNWKPAEFGSSSNLAFTLMDFGSTFHFAADNKLCFTTGEYTDKLYVVDFAQNGHAMLVSQLVKDGEEPSPTFGTTTNENGTQLVFRAQIPALPHTLNWSLPNPPSSRKLGTLYAPDYSLVNSAGQLLAKRCEQGRFTMHASFVNDPTAGYSVQTTDRAVAEGLRYWASVSKSYCVAFTSNVELVVFDATGQVRYQKRVFGEKPQPVLFQEINQHGNYLLLLRSDTIEESTTLYAANLTSLVDEPDNLPNWFPVAYLPPNYCWSWSGECHAETDRYIYLTGTSLEKNQNMLIVFDLLFNELSRCYMGQYDVDEDPLNENGEVDSEAHLGAWVVDEYGTALWYSKSFCFAMAAVYEEEEAEAEEEEQN